MIERIMISRCQEPAWNLAVEEALLQQGTPLLFLWQNRPSVILGRNQNPYRECDPRLLQEEGVNLVRRKSGGGAVYHDLGNLNITMLTRKAPGAVEQNLRLLQQLLGRLGIPARRTGRNDLEVQGRKISGSAFYEVGDRLCHHCTLLIHTDFEKMERYLTPSDLKLQSRSIASIRSRVGNLSQWVPGLTVRDVEAAFLAGRSETPTEFTLGDLMENQKLCRLAERYQSFEWTYGECPAGTVTLEDRFSWGCVRAELQVESGTIAACGIYTDSLVTGGFRELARALTGKPLQRESCREIIGLSGLPPQIRQDLQTLFEKI